MSALRVYYAVWRGPCAVAGGALDGLLARSDTLSAAMVCMWPHTDGRADMDRIAAAPPFRVSSALPWVRSTEEGRRHMLWPVAPSVRALAAAIDVDHADAWRNTRYVDATILESIARAGRLPDTIRRGQAGALACTWDWAWPGRGRRRVKPAERALSNTESRARRAVDRRTRALVGSPDDQRCHVPTGLGGFAIVADVGPDALRFEAALEILGERGLGRRRGAGWGGFRVVGREDLEPPDLGRGARLSVSLCRPTSGEVVAGILRGSYELLDRGGVVSTDGFPRQPRGAVRMMAEGALVPGDEPSRPGDLAQVAEVTGADGVRHAIYRDGRALTIAIGDSALRTRAA